MNRRVYSLVMLVSLTQCPPKTSQKENVGDASDVIVSQDCTKSHGHVFVDPDLNPLKLSILEFHRGGESHIEIDPYNPDMSVLGPMVEKDPEIPLRIAFGTQKIMLEVKLSMDLLEFLSNTDNRNWVEKLETIIRLCEYEGTSYQDPRALHYGLNAFFLKLGARKGRDELDCYAQSFRETLRSIVGQDPAQHQARVDIFNALVG